MILASKGEEKGTWQGEPPPQAASKERGDVKGHMAGKQDGEQKGRRGEVPAAAAAAAAWNQDPKHGRDSPKV